MQSWQLFTRIKIKQSVNFNAWQEGINALGDQNTTQNTGREITQYGSKCPPSFTTKPKIG